MDAVTGQITNNDLQHARSDIEIRQVGSRGRGIFARSTIEQGQLVERSPVLIIPDEQRMMADTTILFTYVFMWEHDTVEEDLYQHKGRAAVALGLTSLLNHSYKPNCRFVRHINELLIDIVAIREIQAGEELTIDYQMTLWFVPEDTA
jgi:SET domain-containing protein